MIKDKIFIQVFYVMYIKYGGGGGDSLVILYVCPLTKKW